MNKQLLLEKALFDVGFLQSRFAFIRFASEFWLHSESLEFSPGNLNFSENPYISVRIGVKKDAEKPGGMNIFGKLFGNYSQNLTMRIEKK